MKNWVTLFPLMKNAYFVKNVGQFPFIAHCEGGFKSSIACYDSEPFSMVSETPGVKLDYIENKGSIQSDSIRYLFKNAREIDVLHVFHIKHETLFSILTYKVFNPKGKVWLDTDTNINWLDVYERKKTGRLAERVDHNLESVIMSLCTLVSAPSSLCADRVKKIWNISSRKVHFIPLGYITGKKQFDLNEKEKTFICVGRLGAKEKNVELLVNAFCQTIQYHDWDLILIGTSTEEFNQYIDKKKRQYKAYDRILLKKEISDRDELYKEYAKASVLVLPSRYESFGIVLCEAMAQGCYLLSSDSISAKKDIIQNDRIGICFRNNRLSDLKEKLISITRSEYLSRGYVEYRRSFAERFAYKEIYKKLSRYI